MKDQEKPVEQDKVQIHINVAGDNSGTIIGVKKIFRRVYLQYKSDPNRMYCLLVVSLLLACTYFLLDEQTFIAQQYRLKKAVPLDSNLVLIGLGSSYVYELDGIRITRKDSLARLIKQVSEANPRVIALDYLVAEIDSGYWDLQQVVENTPGLVFAIQREKKNDPTREKLNYAFPITHDIPDSMKKKVWVGYSNIEAGYVLEMMNMAPVDQYQAIPPVPSFAMAVLGAWHNPEKMTDRHSKAKWAAIIDSLYYPVSITDKVPINYFEIDDKKKVKRAEDIEFYISDLKDKIVLIGNWEEYPIRDQDMHQTPFGLVSGVMIQAAVINNLLQRSYIRKLDKTWVWSGVLAGLIVGAWGMYWPNKEKKPGKSKKNLERLKLKIWLPLLGIVGFWIFYIFWTVFVLSVFDSLWPTQTILIALLWGALIGVVMLSVREERILEKLILIQNEL